MQTVSITTKWQVYIPVAIRQKLGLIKPVQAVVSVKGDTIVLKPKSSRILLLDYIRLVLSDTINPCSCKESRILSSTNRT